MKSLSLLVALAFFVAAGLACARKDNSQVPAAVPVDAAPPGVVRSPVAVPSETIADKPEKGGRKTLFERYEKRRHCHNNSAFCDGEFFEMDIKKTIENEIDPDNNLSTQFCVGGCTKRSVLQWSLEWQ